jgi:hypothetical protein
MSSSPFARLPATIVVISLVCAIWGCTEKDSPVKEPESSAGGYMDATPQEQGNAQGRTADAPKWKGNKSMASRKTGKEASPPGSGKAAKAAGGGSGRKGPRTTPEEKAVLELAERLGGTAKRPPAAGGPPGPVALIDLPGKKAKDADLRVVAELPEIYMLRVESPGFTDEGVRLIASAKRGLGTLHLAGKTFTDKGVAALAGHPKLRILILEAIDLEGPGLAALQDNEPLEFLDLIDIPMTPEIMEGLKQLRKLRELRLIRTGVDQQQLETLHDHLPDVDLVVEQADSKKS